MGHRNAACFSGMLELLMAAFHMHEEPSIRFEFFDYISALHGYIHTIHTSKVKAIYRL